MRIGKANTRNNANSRCQKLLEVLANLCSNILILGLENDKEDLKCIAINLTDGSESHGPLLPTGHANQKQVFLPSFVRRGKAR